MIKAGLLGAVVGFIYVMSLTLLSPFCTLCFTPLLGIGIGYLTGSFDQPHKAESSLRHGLVAGTITGLGAVAGQIAATIVNGILITNLEDLPALFSQLGLPETLLVEADQYWQATLSTNSVCGSLNLMIIAGLGAAGSLIWFQRQSRDRLGKVSS